MNHTYADLSAGLKAPALEMLAEELAPALAEITTMYKADPAGWAIPHHFFWGMSVRNLLRGRGYGEDYFSVDNLDDFYIPLVEEALKLAERPSPQYLPHQPQLAAEKSELDEKIGKLHQFFSSSTYAGLDSEEQERLSAQVVAMERTLRF